MGKGLINTRCFRHSPNVAMQIAAMKSMFPQFIANQNGKKLYFVGKLKVHKDLPEYKVKVEYRGASRPYVSVISPRLEDDAPHIYPQSRHLCLYRPDKYKWTASKLVAQDIIPWTAAWIYFYEYWLRTGSWLGPEAPHLLAKSEDIR